MYYPTATGYQMMASPVPLVPAAVPGIRSCARLITSVICSAVLTLFMILVVSYIMVLESYTFYSVSILVLTVLAALPLGSLCISFQIWKSLLRAIQILYGFIAGYMGFVLLYVIIIVGIYGGTKGLLDGLFGVVILYNAGILGLFTGAYVPLFRLYSFGTTSFAPAQIYVPPPTAPTVQPVQPVMGIPFQPPPVDGCCCAGTKTA